MAGTLNGCSLSGPCKDLRERLDEGHFYEPPTPYRGPARLSLGNLRLAGCPFCLDALPGYLFEAWAKKGIIQPLPAIVNLPAAPSAVPWIDSIPQEADDGS